MGKYRLTSLQTIVLDELSKDGSLNTKFYFGGGTALSYFYLQHRISDDLYFFCKTKFDKKIVVNFINKLTTKYNLTSKMTAKDMVLWFELKKKNEYLKVDFLEFPYQSIEKGIMYKNIYIDNSLDIGANKLLLITLEKQPKDYVDLYFLLKERFTIWDLIYAVENKYKLQMDILGLGKDLLAVKEIDILPKMIKPLTLKQLKFFFFQIAKELGNKIIIK